FKKIPEKDIEENGKKIAQTVLERIRKMDGLENVPIMIALYREASQDSPVPGNFIMKTTIPEGDMSIEEWDEIDADYVLFASDEEKEDHFETHQVVEDCGNAISDYVPNYVGVNGEGFYNGDELRQLTLEIPLDFYGKGEIIAFTQYVYGLVQENFPVGYDLEIEISSSEQLESVIYREPGEEEPSVHIFH